METNYQDRITRGKIEKIMAFLARSDTGTVTTMEAGLAATKA